MSEKNLKNKHYNIPGHAHGLTFSCFKGIPFFNDNATCESFLLELERTRREFSILIWAYVLMPNHVHLLIWPTKKDYDISKICKSLKGRFARRHIAHLKKVENNTLLTRCTVIEKGVNKHRVWQRGGGFDRNVWNAKDIGNTISYIEANPIRQGLAFQSEEWKWSSAYSRKTKIGLIPDDCTMHIRLGNPQSRRVDIV